MRLLVFGSCLIAAALSGLVGCTGPARPTGEWVVLDSLAPLRRAPTVAGRAICSTVSPVSDSTPIVVDCDLGAKTTLRVRGDTTYAHTHTRTDVVADATLPLLDYWNLHLRSEVEAAAGRAPDQLGGDASPTRSYLEARWDDPRGVRRLVTLTRAPENTILVTQVLIDCRPISGRVRAIACY